MRGVSKLPAFLWELVLLLTCQAPAAGSFSVWSHYEQEAEGVRSRNFPGGAGKLALTSAPLTDLQAAAPLRQHHFSVVKAPQSPACQCQNNLQRDCCTWARRAAVCNTREKSSLTGMPCGCSAGSRGPEVFPLRLSAGCHAPGPRSAPGALSAPQGTRRMLQGGLLNPISSLGEPYQQSCFSQGCQT